MEFSVFFSMNNGDSEDMGSYSIIETMVTCMIVNDERETESQEMIKKDLISEFQP